MLIIALFPFIAASWLLDRRPAPTSTDQPSRQPPRGARSATGQPISQTRPKPRIKRSKRAAQLETIVVEAETTGNASIQANSSNSPIADGQDRPLTGSKFVRSRRMKEDSEMDQQVQDQLDAIEHEMAKLEEQLEQNGISSSPSNSQPTTPVESEEDSPNSEVVQPNPVNATLSTEEVTSELQAIDELLKRLEQRKHAGGVDEDTYQRLREKYLKRRSELS